MFDKLLPSLRRSEQIGILANICLLCVLLAVSFLRHNLPVGLLLLVAMVFLNIVTSIHRGRRPIGYEPAAMIQLNLGSSRGRSDQNLSGVSFSD